MENYPKFPLFAARKQNSKKKYSLPHLPKQKDLTQSSKTTPICEIRWPSSGANNGQQDCTCLSVCVRERHCSLSNDSWSSSWTQSPCQHGGGVPRHNQTLPEATAHVFHMLLPPNGPEHPSAVSIRAGRPHSRTHAQTLHANTHTAPPATQFKNSEQ